MKIVRGPLAVATTSILIGVCGCADNERTSNIKDLQYVAPAADGSAPPRSQQDLQKQYMSQQKGMEQGYGKQVGGGRPAAR
jgi:hypothetical protein